MHWKNIDKILSVWEKPEVQFPRHSFTKESAVLTNHFLFWKHSPTMSLPLLCSFGSREWTQSLTYAMQALWHGAVFPFLINIHLLQGHPKSVCFWHAEIAHTKKVAISKIAKIAATGCLKLPIEQKYFLSIECFEESCISPSDPNHINEVSILFQGYTLLVSRLPAWHRLHLSIEKPSSQ